MYEKCISSKEKFQLNFSISIVFIWFIWRYEKES